MEQIAVDYVRNALQNLNDRLSDQCVMDPTRGRVLQHCETALEALERHDIAKLADSLEALSICLVSAMGHDLSAASAEVLIDGIVPESMCLVAGEARAYEVGVIYAKRLFLLRDLARADPDDSFTPDPGKVLETCEVLRSRVDLLGLSPSQHAAFVAPLDTLQELARQDPFKVQRKSEEAMVAWFRNVRALENVAFTASTANFLRGRIVFAAAGATCLIALTWPWQIAIGLGIIVIGGAIYIFDSVQAKYAFKDVTDVIDDLGKPDGDIDTTVDDAADGLDDAEVDELIDKLKQRKAGLRRDPAVDKQDVSTLERRIDRAIKRLESAPSG